MSRKSWTVSLVVVVLIASYSSAGAQEPEFNVYFDEALTVTSMDCPGLGLDTLYVALENANASVNGAQFKVNLPTSLTWIADLGTPPSTIGTTVTGIAMGWSPPSNGFFPVLLAKMLVRWNCLNCQPSDYGLIELVGHPALGDELAFTEYPNGNKVYGVGGWAVALTPPTIRLLYWADLTSIRSFDIGGSSATELVAGLPAPRDVAVDVAGGKLYWVDSNEGGIRRRNLDGSGPTENLIDNLGSPTSLALDVAAGKVYWSDWEDDVIVRADVANGANVDTLFTNQPAPRGIALHVAKRYIYWVDSTTDEVRRGSFDGGSAETLVDTGLDFPWDIALNVAGNTMYWIDSGTKKIQSSDMRGTTPPADVVVGLDEPRSVVLDIEGGYLYWSDIGKGRIQRAHVNSPANITDVLLEPVARSLFFLQVDCNSLTGIDDDPKQTLPKEMAIRSVYPNPFNPSVTVRFDLDRPRNVEIAIYDVSGRLIRRLGDDFRAGTHEVRWNGRDEAGSNVATGVYFLRVMSEAWQDHRKVVLLK